MRLLALTLLACAASVSSTLAATASRALDQGEINGAKYAIVLPAQWNRQLILVAPPLRPESEPLAAAFSPEDVAYKTLFTEGWMIAKTSFRRNGIVIADGLADLDALRAYVVQKYGQPERVLVTGESLGGLVSLLVAEREPRQPPLYHGVLSISPNLQLRENPATIGLSLQPKIPIIFLVNQGEIEGPKGYIASPFARESSLVTPAVSRIARGGRANLNQRERLTALRTLNLWVERGPTSLPRPEKNDLFFDGTIPAEPRPSAVTMQAGGHGFEAHVTALAASPGQVLLDAQAADFAAADIRPSTWFRLVVHEKTYRVFYGRDFDSVKRNEWVIVPSAEGNFILARNFGNAITTAKLAPGDTLRIERFDPQ